VIASVRSLAALPTLGCSDKCRSEVRNFRPVRTVSRLAVKFMAGVATKGSSAKPQGAVERQKRQNESDTSSANYDRRRIGTYLIAVALIILAVALAWTVATIVIAIVGIESLRSL